MKLIKVFMLVGLLTALATALIGTSSAMAESTVLCKVDKSPCPEASWVKSVHFVAKSVVFEPEEYNYKCEALLTAEALGLGSPEVLDVTSLQYVNCNQGCTRTAIKLGTLKVLRTGSELASVTGEGGEILVKCSNGIHCVFDLGGTAGTLSGPLLTGGTAHLTYSKALLHKIAGFFCPSEVTLTALFEALEAFYISS
jgi:hypothetical protein